METENKETNIEKSELESLTEVLEKAQKEVLEWKDKCTYLAADFENYKRRTQQDLSSWTFTTQKKVFEDLLPIIDDFDRAIEQLQTSESSEEQGWSEGIIMIHEQLEKLLKKHNVQIIPTEGVFNPELHEALMQVDSEEHESGVIVATLQKGYIIGDRVLRPAKVSVAK